MRTPPSVSTQLEYCTYCPKMCRHACPVSTTTGRETWIPQQKMARLHDLRRGVAGWDAPSAEPLWACTGCRQCTVYCEHGNEPGTVLMAGRAEAVARGVGHPALADYPDRFRAREARLARKRRDALPRDLLAADALVVFWPGCDAIDKDIAGVAAALDLFGRAGAEHVRVPVDAPVCGGYPLLAAGHTDMFRWHAEKVAAALKGCSQIILNCSACVPTLRSLYPAEGVALGAEVLHLSEFFAQLIDRLPEPANKPAVYYHDPCYLARHAGVMEAPRRALARVAQVREFSWSREDTECCGGAGALPKTMPAVADAMARRRLADIARKGGGTVVTACATCAFMLRRNAPSSVRVDDLPAALARGIAAATE
ncbi:MAG: (Fe-S)-binding protein [Deltaproteobacteria bacterium]|nr:MAG: (Fe-S)-binding protein [Deltaproteobacteria bacterium]